jgi:hypothetical protein
MAITIVDLTKYAGRWVAQREDGTVIADADTYAELKRALTERGIDARSVTITQVPKDDGALLL